MTLSYQDIAEILKAIDNSEAEEIEIEVEGLRLAVRKRTQNSGILAESMAPATIDHSPPVQPTVDEPVAKPQPATPQQEIKIAEGHEIVRSPMVGTFYCRPSPEEPKFVKQGSTVNVGDPLCLIEVMKLYTTIESTVSGTVISVFAEDGELVEFNQQLFLIKAESFT